MDFTVAAACDHTPEPCASDALGITPNRCTVSVKDSGAIFILGEIDIGYVPPIGLLSHDLQSIVAFSAYTNRGRRYGLGLKDSIVNPVVFALITHLTRLRPQ